MKNLIIAISGIFILALSAQAEDGGNCQVHYERTACPGQEEISFAKCGGNATCTKPKTADTLEACQAAATKSCRNRRLNITQAKVITATWLGEAIKSEAGHDDFCLTYEKRAEEFNQCDAM